MHLFHSTDRPLKWRLTAGDGQSLGDFSVSTIEGGVYVTCPSELGDFEARFAMEDVASAVAYLTALCRDIGAVAEKAG